MLTTVRNTLFKQQTYQLAAQTITSGVIVGFLQLMVAFSLASLLFSGKLAPYLSQGVALFLVTIMLSTLLSAVVSSEYRLFPNLQSSLVLIMLGLVTAMSIQPGKALLPTIVATISITTIVTGLSFYIFGRLRWVQFIRYVPYPVIGGFLAGYGWLLVWSGLSQGQPTTAAIWSFETWLDLNYLSVWLPSLLIGGALLLSTRYSGHFAVVPSILLLSSLLIHGWIWSQGWSVNEAASRGILVNNLGQIEWIPPIALDVTAIDWQAIAGQWIRILMIVTVGLIHMLLNLSSFEVVAEQRFDIDAKVRSSGILNVAVGLFGGHALFQSMSISTLNHKIGSNNPVAYLIASGFIGIILVAGTQLLQLMPVSVLGGLLIYLGLEFIDTWGIRGLRRFTPVEYTVALIIMFIVIFVGVLEGFFAGVIMMLLVFVASYSQTSIIYRAASGENLSSTIAHTPYHATILTTLRRDVYVMELTGYLFFGSSNRIVNAIEEYFEANVDIKLRFLILDFRRVSGMDSSALLSLRSILVLAEQREFEIYLSAIDNNPQAMRLLSHIERARLHFAPGLDEAIGVCEEKLLEIYGTTQVRIPSVIWLQLANLGMKKSDAKALQKVMHHTRFEDGDIILEQGDEADCIYFLEIGQVSVLLQNSDGEQIRLRTINMGSVFGEIGFVLEQPRTASIVANMTSIVWTLSRDDLQQLRTDAPEIAFAFEHTLLTILAERITASNKLIKVLR